MAPTEGDVERADGLAAELLDVADLQAGTYTMMALLRSAMLSEESSRSSHWLTVELAWRGFGLTDAPVRAHEMVALDSAFAALLGGIAEAGGVDAALASADSILNAIPDPTLAAVVNANLYRLTVEERPELALEYARAFTDARGSVDSWRIANRLAVDIRDRGLDYDLALDLSGWALELSQTRSDSQTVTSTTGWTHHLMGDNETARDYLDRSLALLEDSPSMDESVVRRALTVYEEEKLYGPAIDLLATVIARSIAPNEEARALLADFLDLAGRDQDSVPELVASHRYAGVELAPYVSFVGSSGVEVALTELRGRVVLLCFWSYG
jgi:tetratricopeptide (TPR) repeat protein